MDDGWMSFINVTATVTPPGCCCNNFLSHAWDKIKYFLIFFSHLKTFIPKVRLKKFGSSPYGRQLPRHVAQLILLPLVVGLAVLTQKVLPDHVKALGPHRCVADGRLGDKGVPVQVDALKHL